MDFTFIIALILSVLIGFISALVFAALRGRSYWRLVGCALILALLADFALLIDWSRSKEMTADLLLIVVAFFVGYGLIGIIVGALPVVGLRWIYRALKDDRRG